MGGNRDKCVMWNLKKVVLEGCGVRLEMGGVWVFSVMFGGVLGVEMVC